MIKVTQRQRQEFIREKLKTSDTWATKALIKIFEAQTKDEQNSDNTSNLNSVGFAPCDAFILSKLAKFYMEKRFLSPKQMNIVFKKIHKYCRQIDQISNVEQINNLILAK